MAEAKATDIKAPALAVIDTAVLAVLVRSGIQMVLLDARGEGGKKIPSSKSLEVKSTASEVEEIAGAKDSLVVTYCTDLHCPASRAMYKHLKDLGYENVLEYQDGVEGWEAAGYPVEGG
jgi:rhodanese-related sulfurtransferase